MFSPLDLSSKWFGILSQGVLWGTLIILLYRWVASRNPARPSPGAPPGLKVPFYSVYGHLRTFPSYAVMKKMSLTLNAVILQILAGYGVLFQKEPIFQLVVAYHHFIILTKSKAVEYLLSSNSLLEKAPLYTMLHASLGTGLITSHGSKWKSRRKMLTPSFHFDILKDFLPVMDEQAKILVGILKIRTNEESADILHPLALCSLDIICETTLGVHIGAQTDSQSNFVVAVLRTSRVVMQRLASPVYQSEIIFQLSKLGRQFKKDQKTIHDLTRKVIQERKMALRLEESNPHDGKSQDFPDQWKKKRKALMDILLNFHLSSPDFTEEDVREEVDTFTLAGHDTIASGLGWALYLIGLYPEVQGKVHQEIDEIYGDDAESPTTMDDLKEMHYLERVLKESQRLYPSVPLYARSVKEDIDVCGYRIKKGSTIAVNTYMLHRDPEVFPNPEIFDPDRFLPENSAGRSPYAYVPFSAGPRNCIGQRFAMMELKTVISNILRTFHVKSLEHRDKICPSAEVILRSERPLKLRFTPRKSSS